MLLSLKTEEFGGRGWQNRLLCEILWSSFFSELGDVQNQIFHLFFYFLVFAETSPMHRLARQAMDPNKMLQPSSTSQLKVSKTLCLIKITTSPQQPIPIQGFQFTLIIQTPTNEMLDTGMVAHLKSTFALAELWTLTSWCWWFANANFKVLLPPGQLPQPRRGVARPSGGAE